MEGGFPSSLPYVPGAQTAVMNTSTIKPLMPVYFSERWRDKPMRLVAVERGWDAPLPSWLERGRQLGSGFTGEYLLTNSIFSQLLEVALIIHKQHFNLLSQCWQRVPAWSESAWGGPLKAKASWSLSGIIKYLLIEFITALPKRKVVFHSNFERTGEVGEGGPCRKNNLLFYFQMFQSSAYLMYSKPLQNFVTF